MREFIAARPWIIALLAGFLVQAMKFLAHWGRHRKPNFRVLTRTGGMPSSHSAGVCALTTSIGVLDGTKSPLFSVVLYFSLIVMYDATGLRRSAGLQATILNRIVDEQFIHHRKAGEGRLMELLGHTPLEVLVGALLGILFALTWYPARPTPDKKDRMGRYLDMIDSPADMKKLSADQLRTLADEVRDEIIHVVSETGGHLGASLGTVELTVALLHVFDSPTDKLVWDVGHQAYPHKILTGRRDRFPSIRQYKGLSGFLRRDESIHDAFGAGHASTSVSAALGMAAARDQKGEKFKVVAIIGDGGLTGGMAFEALNNAGDLKTDVIVVVNDNEMSISPNVGAMTKYLTRLTSAPIYRRFETDVYELLGKIPAVGHPAQELAGRVKESLGNLVLPTVFFEELGFKYFGPIDGHNLDGMIDTMKQIREIGGPIVLHVLTRKGKGYRPAEADRLALHGVTQFDKTTGAMKKKEAKAPTYSNVFAEALAELADKDPRIIAISAAMIEGTGLRAFEKRHPTRTYDVGIAEQHAVTFAAGMATQGLKPVCAIYSTFLQRAYDQIVHDVCLQDLDVTFVLDRAGLAGDDGATHHGVFDMAYLRTIPGMVVMAPKDEAEARDMLYTAIEHPGPAALRIPRGEGQGIRMAKDFTKLPIGEGEIVRDGTDLTIVAIGAMVEQGLRVAEELERRGISCGVVNARFVKPIDAELIADRVRRSGKLVALEEHSPHGGFGAAVMECLAERRISGVPLLHLALPDRFVHHGSRDLLLREVGLDVPTITETIATWLATPAGTPANPGERRSGV